MEMMTPPAGAPIFDADPFTEDNLRDPYSWHALLRDAGALVWLSRYQVWATGRYAEAHTILTDWQTYCSSAGVGLANFHTETPWRPPSLLLEADPPYGARVAFKPDHPGDGWEAPASAPWLESLVAEASQKAVCCLNKT